MREIVEYMFTIVNPGPTTVNVRDVRAPQGEPVNVKMTVQEATQLKQKPGWIVTVYDELDAFRPNSALQFLRRSLSSADILGLGTPIQLLPPPGAGKLYAVESVMYCLNFKTAPYSGDQTGLWYGESISADGGSTGVFNGTESQTQQSISWSVYTAQPFPELCINNALNLWSPNSSAAGSGGDGTGSITVSYFTVDV